MTNLEGRVIRRRRLHRAAARRPDRPGGAGRAVRPARARRPAADPRVVFDELRRASAGGVADYAGITLRADRGRGRRLLALPGRGPSGHAADVPRPVRHPGRPGPVRRPSSTGRRPRSPDADYPLYLTTGRVLTQYQSGAQTRRIAGAARRRRSSSCIPTWRPARDRRRRPGHGHHPAGHARRPPARLSDAIRADTVFMPFHYAGAARANTLTNPALDPVSRMPEFKVCAARVAPA